MDKENAKSSLFSLSETFNVFGIVDPTDVLVLGISFSVEVEVVLDSVMILDLEVLC